MNDYPLLTSIEYCNELIHTWPYVEVGDRREHRLYYKVDEDPGTGFDFYSVMWAGCIANDNNDIWDESVEVECGIHGNARFDGLRHLYWGDEKTNNYGYHYYADLKDEIAILQALRQLEVAHCRDYED